ncbi:DNA-directed RNA polymerase I subunit RPA43 isoform X2 [Ixodes scapularis]|uniref:DNA-directed RNA polymerase I subunit RPA43 isoform X2 n=1 Tax=Ixodes scapularis TaxID=6945 RepID=UPI001A9DFAC1|nr:DNA-directed RNA polymerase I subunit RPA43 isoform X2 [Ixodes scapularis]
MAAKHAGKFSNFPLDDKYSLLTNCHEVIHVPLPPSYINTKVRGIKKLLDSWRGQYVQRLDGVLLDYGRPALVGSSGSILGDQPYIHEDVAADFLVFRPRPGSLVRGRINNLQVMLETVPVVRASHEEELEEYESNYGGDSEWDEGGASEAEEDPQGPSYLDPEEDFTTGRPLPLAAEEPKTPSGRKGAGRAKRKRPGEDGTSSTGDRGTLGLLGSDGLSAADTVSMSDGSVAPQREKKKKKKKKEKIKDSTSDGSTQLEKKKKKKKAEVMESRETSPASPARPRKKKLFDLDRDDEALLTFQNSISFLRKGKSKTGKHGQM